MKKVLFTTTALAMAGSMAAAAGLDRSLPNYGVLFAEGNQVELSFSTTRPSVKGTHPAASAGALGVSTDSENMANSESFFGFAAKTQITDRLSFGFFFNEPFGADAEYTQGLYSQAPGFARLDVTGDSVPDIALIGGTNLKARWQSRSYEAVLRYDVTSAASVFGGLRAVTSSAEIALPAQLVAVSSGNTLPGDYFAEASQETDIGYIIGAAYQIPDIAARVAVTYRSEIEHEFDVNESASNTQVSLTTGAATMNTLLSQSSKTKIKIPQSVTIDFQTGIAEDTLLFGSARWTEWSQWDVATEGYTAATGDSITGFENDTWTYSLGVGRRINDSLSVFGTVGYEEPKGGDLNRLAPTDGSTSIGLGGAYTFTDGTVVRAGLQHAWLGGGETSDGTEFEDSTATSFGVSLGLSF